MQQIHINIKLIYLIIIESEIHIYHSIILIFQVLFIYILAEKEQNELKNIVISLIDNETPNLQQWNISCIYITF